MQKIDFIHPEDAAALEALKNIPVFPAVLKAFMDLGAEQLQFRINMASKVKLIQPDGTLKVADDDDTKHIIQYIIKQNSIEDIIKEGRNSNCYREPRIKSMKLQ